MAVLKGGGDVEGSGVQGSCGGEGMLYRHRHANDDEQHPLQQGPRISGCGGGGGNEGSE